MKRQHRRRGVTPNPLTGQRHQPALSRQFPHKVAFSSGEHRSRRGVTISARSLIVQAPAMSSHARLQPATRRWSNSIRHTFSRTKSSHTLVPGSRCRHRQREVPVHTGTSSAPCVTPWMTIAFMPLHDTRTEKRTCFGSSAREDTTVTQGSFVSIPRSKRSSVHWCTCTPPL